MGGAAKAIVSIGLSFFLPGIGAAFGLGTFGTAVLGMVLNTGLTAIAGSMFGGGETGSTGDNVRNSGIMVNNSSSVTVLPVVYGTRRVGPKRVFVDTTGDDNKYIHMVMAVSEGEIFGIGNVYYNDVPIGTGRGIATQTRVEGGVVVDGTAGTTSVADGAAITYYDKIADPQNPTTAVIDNPYGSKSQIYVHYGTDAQTVDTNLQTAVGATRWTNNHRLRGVAYIYVRLEYDREVFGGIPDITVDVVGKKIRTYAVGADEIADGTLTTVTEGSYNNPAWILFDYLINPRYGRGIAVNKLDIQSFIDSAASCNESRTIDTVTLAKRFVINAHCDPDNTLYMNVKNILTSCNGFLIYTGGLYRLKIDDAVATEDINFVFDESNIIGGIDITLSGKTDRFNQVKINYFDSSKEWIPNIVIVKDDDYLAYDGNTELVKELELPMVTDYNRVQYLARLFLNGSRYGTSVTFDAAPSALVCSVGEVVYLTHPTPDWTNKPFRINAMRIKADGTLTITATEYIAEVYTSLGTIPAQTAVTNYSKYATPFFSPLKTTVAQPTNLTATNTPQGSTTAVTVSFTAPTASQNIRHYIIAYTDGGTTQEYTTTATTATITGLKNQTSYTIQVYAENFDGVRSQPATT